MAKLPEDAVSSPKFKLPRVVQNSLNATPNDEADNLKNTWIKPNDRMEGPVMNKSLDATATGQAARERPRDSSQSLPPCHKANEKEWETETVFFDAQFQLEKAMKCKSLKSFWPEILTKYAIMLVCDNNHHKRSLNCFHYLDPYIKWIRIGIG